MNLWRCIISFLCVFHSTFLTGITAAETEKFALRVFSLDSQTNKYQKIGFVAMSGGSLLVGTSKDQAIFKIDNLSLAYQGRSQNQIHIKSDPSGALQLNSGKVIHFKFTDAPQPGLFSSSYYYLVQANENPKSQDFNDMYVFAYGPRCPKGIWAIVQGLFMRTDQKQLQGCQAKIIFELCKPGST